MKTIILSIILSIVLTTNSLSQTFGNDSTNEREQKETPTIIIYGSDTCHYCIDTKNYLKEKNITFVYYDVDINLEKQHEMLAKLAKANIPVSSLNLPVIDKNGTVFTNSEDFEKFLKRIVLKN